MDAFISLYGNAIIETIGGLLIWHHVITIRRDKTFKGGSLLPLCFFTAWGVWNLYYYPFIANDVISGWAGVMPAVANFVWLGHIFYYLRRERRAAVDDYNARFLPMEGMV